MLAAADKILAVMDKLISKSSQGIVTPAGSKVVQVIVAEKILADYGLRLWRFPGTSIT